MHRSLLAASAVPAAVAGDVIAASVMAELANAGHLTVQFTFAYGSGGTTATYWLQTSLDGGASWIDIACVQFTTASAKQVFNIDAGGYVTPGYVPGDGTLAVGSVVDGILGDRLRIKQTIVGTYADSTIAVDVVDKAGVGAQKRAPGQTTAAASTPVVGPKDAIARLDEVYTRVSDTNGYTAGDEVSDNTTAGSATPGQLASAPLVSGGGLLIVGGLLMTSDKACVAQFRTHFYNAAPTMSGDNIAFGWKIADRLKWLGYIDWDAFSTEDATNSDGAFAMAGAIRLPMVPAATTIYYRHETKTTFTPASGQTFTMSLFPAR